MISGYCGRGTRLDEALTRFAVSYADQIERDHQALKDAVSAGRLCADEGPDLDPQHALLGWPDLALGT